MSKYPNDFDTNAEIPAVNDNITEIGSDAINGLIEAVFAIQQALGLDPQGSANDLTTRLAEALNDDGTIKAAALAAAGLVTLPITNAQVGSSAAIQESKLDLDVSTQTLQNQISSNDIDIASLQDQLATQITRVTRHVLGIAERHDSDHIDHTLVDGYGFGAGSTVESALNFIWGSFLAHRGAATDIQHEAQVIRYVPQVAAPGETPVITATNVQDAIDQFDLAFLEDRRKHNDSAHSDGISADGYVYLDGQAAVNDASLKPTRYQSALGGPDIMKIGLCNAAVVKSRNFTQNAITSFANSLTVTAKVGTETRAITLTDIHLGGANEGVYPPGTGRLTLQGIVDSFNTQFASVRFPVTAFASNDGELVLQHNIDRDDCTLTLTNPASFSAGAELGFGDVLGTEVFRQETYRYHVNGTPFTELKTISDGYITQPGASTIVNLGVDVTATGLDLRQNQLLHIFSHSAGSGDSGTYRIVSTSGITSVIVDSSIDAGDLGYIIYEDAVNTNFTGSARTIDMYIDSNRNLVASVRAQITSSQMSGLLSMVEVSQDFPADVGSTLALTKSGTTYSLVLTVNSVAGPTTTFEEGYIGLVKVIGPDNKSFVQLLVVDPLSPVPRTDTITFTASEFQDNRLLLGTTHVRSGAAITEIPLDRRNVGLVGNTAVGTEFIEDVLQRDIANLHLSGVVRGFDVVSNTTTSLVLNGGFAYVDGKAVCLTRRTLQVTNVASSAGTWNLILTKNGTLELYDDATSGFTVAEALRTDNFIVIAQITIGAGPVISSITDARFLVNDVESRIQLTVDDRTLGAGSFRNLDSAVLYSREAPNDTKPEITVLSDLTVSNDFTADAGSRLVAFNDLSFSGDLTLSANSELEVFGTLSVSGQVFLQSGAKLVCKGDAVFSGNTDMQDDSVLVLESDATVQIIQISGDRVQIIGSEDDGTVTFAGVADGIQTSGAREDILLRNLDLSMTASTNSIFTLGGATTDVRVERCVFRQASTLTVGQLVASRAGIDSSGSPTINGLKISDCEFTNLGRGILGDSGSTWNDVAILNTDFDSLGGAIGLLGGNRVLVSNCLFESTHTFGIRLDGSISDTIISNCFFVDEFDVTSTSNPVSSTDTTNRIIIEGCTFENFSTFNIVSLLDGDGAIVEGNTISNCNTTSHAFSLTTITNAVVANNTIVGHTGELISCINSVVVGNVMVSAGSAGGTSLNLSASSNGGVFASNRVVVSETTDSATIRNYTVTGNYIQIGSVSIQESSTGALIAGNEFDLIDTAATNSIEIDSSTSLRTIFSNNIVIGAGITSALLLDDGVYSVVGNLIDGSACGRAITVGTNSTSSANLFQVNNNFIKAGAAFAINVDASNIMISGNFTTGSVAADDILVTASKTNVYIANNFSNTTGVGGGSIRHTDTSPTNVFIGLNKNAQSQYVYSVLDSLQTAGTWTSSVTLPTVIELLSATTNDQLVIPITGLPTGAQLESVALLADTPGGAGTLAIRLFRRQASTGTTVTEIATSASNLAAIYQTITITPTSTEYIGRNNEYILYIESTASGNRIGQVVATFRY